MSDHGEAPRYIGIDLGTSGCRGVVMDGAGAPVARCSVPIPAPDRREGGIVQDPAIWWAAVSRVLDQLVSPADRAGVRALAVDGTSASVLLTDRNGVPLAPARMYNDNSAREQAARIEARAPADSAARGASSSLAKLLDLLDRHPGRVRVLHQADWVAGRLCGRYDICDENNALKLGYDPLRRAWPDWMLPLGVPPESLPAVVPPGTAIGNLTPDLARRWGFDRHTLVAAGTTDSVAAFIATGASAVGDAVTSLGSTLVVKVLADQPVSAPRYGIYSHRLGDRWLAGGASNSGGAALAKHFAPAVLERLSGRIDPSEPSGLDFYPLAAPGERFPISDPDLPPRLTPRPDDDARFLHGMLEGIARIETRGYRLLNELGAPYPTSVWTLGGGAGNRAWTGIRERLLRVPVHSVLDREAALGAARLARQGATGESVIR